MDMGNKTKDLTILEEYFLFPKDEFYEVIFNLTYLRIP